MEFIDFKDNKDLTDKENIINNITACLGCEEIVLFPDLWDNSYCCKGCRDNG